MIKKLGFVLFLILTFITSEVSYAQQFSSYIEGLPLHQSVFEDPDSVLVFDKPAGRIIQFSAYASDVSQNQILKFYKENLLKFGWQKLGQNQKTSQEINFFKGLEKLNIKLNQNDGIVMIDFTLSPIKK